MEREQRRLRQEAWLFWLLKKSLGRLRMEPPGLGVGGYNWKAAELCVGTPK